MLQHTSSLALRALLKSAATKSGLGRARPQLTGLSPAAVAFHAAMAAKTTEAIAAKLALALEGRAEVDLPVDLVAPCYRLVKKQLVPFELGFKTSAGETMTVETVKPGSRAEAAGLRVGDQVDDLRYESGRSNVRVELAITRATKTQRIQFLPAGPSKPGRMFEQQLLRLADGAGPLLHLVQRGD